jgi:hypothetical protein
LNLNKDNLFEDQNISIFYLVEIIIIKWKLVVLIMSLSIPLSGIYYLLADELYLSNSIILVGKKHSTDRDFLESPIILAQKLKFESNTIKDVRKITVITNTNAFYDAVQRTMYISLISTTAEKAQNKLSVIIDDVVKNHELVYLRNKKLTSGDGSIRTAVLKSPTYPVTPVNPINYVVFIEGIILSIILACFFILLQHQMLLIKKVKLLDV